MEKEELLRNENKLKEQVNTAEKELDALRATLDVVRGSNKQLRKAVQEGHRSKGMFLQI